MPVSFSRANLSQSYIAYDFYNEDGVLFYQSSELHGPGDSIHMLAHISSKSWITKSILVELNKDICTALGLWK